MERRGEVPPVVAPMVAPMVASMVAVTMVLGRVPALVLVAPTALTITTLVLTLSSALTENRRVRRGRKML